MSGRHTVLWRAPAPSHAEQGLSLSLCTGSPPLECRLAPGLWFGVGCPYIYFWKKYRLVTKIASVGCLFFFFSPLIEPFKWWGRNFWSCLFGGDREGCCCVSNWLFKADTSAWINQAWVLGQPKIPELVVFGCLRPREGQV